MVAKKKAQARRWTRPKKRKNTKPTTPTQPLNPEDQVLKDIYYNYGEEGALNNSPQVLLRLGREHLPQLTLQEVKDFLTRQPSYTVHRRLARRNFPRHRIPVQAPRLRADADLIELGDLAQWNDGYKYALNVMDSFTKYIWIKAQKSKDPKTTASSFRGMMEEENPPLRCETLYTDAGMEFLGQPFQALLKEKDIAHRICGGEQFHCAFSERANRTLKEKLFQAMSAKLTRRWVDLLPLVVSTYNQTVHRTTGLRPHEVGDKDTLEIYKKMIKKKGKVKRNTKPKFKPGDYVRILKIPGPFTKGYLPRFTWEIFQIADYHSSTWPFSYFLKDLNGEQIKHGVFYEYELSRVDPSLLNAEFPIREILDKRKGGREVLVWWQGLPRSQAKWIPTKNVRQGGDTAP